MKPRPARAAGGQFVPVHRAPLSSAAWRGLSINARRFIDFLMLEWMSHAGKANGQLRAPHRQLEEFGIGARHIAAAIREAEEAGLVDCHRGGMRVATTYALAWLDLHDGSPASDRWKAENLPSEGKAGLPSEGRADGQNLPSEGKADRPKTLPSEGRALSRRRSIQGGDSTPTERVAGEAVPLLPGQPGAEAA